MDAYYGFRDKMIDLYHADINEIKGNDFKNPENFSKIEVLYNVINEKLNNADKYQESSRPFKKIPKLVEAGSLGQELENKFFVYAFLHLEFDKEINVSKKNPFSEKIHE